MPDGRWRGSQTQYRGPVPNAPRPVVRPDRARSVLRADRADRNSGCELKVPESCKHRSGHDGVDTSTAASGVEQPDRESHDHGWQGPASLVARVSRRLRPHARLARKARPWTRASFARACLRIARPGLAHSRSLILSIRVPRACCGRSRWLLHRRRGAVSTALPFCAEKGSSTRRPALGVASKSPVEPSAS